MVTIEQVWRRLFHTEGFWGKVLIGSLLTVLVIPIPVTLGYIYRTTLRIKQGLPEDLPEWDRWQELLIDGLKLLALALIWVGIPVLVGFFVSLIVDAVLPGYFAVVPGMLAWPVGVMLLAASLYRYQNFESFKDALDLGLILQMAIRTMNQAIIPLLASFGILTLLGPLAFICSFIISLVILAFFSSLYRALEQGRL